MTIQEMWLKKDVIKAHEDYIDDFLRKHGYRPRRKVEYYERLKKRLAKKGLEFVVEIKASNPKFTGDAREIEVTGIMEIKCYFKPLGAECRICKHYIFKLMMYGYHGYCDNRNLEDDWFYVRIDDYCEGFEEGRNKIYEQQT